MKLLHVLSQVEITGAETYALELARAQNANGDAVVIISDTLSLPSIGTYISMPIANRRWPMRIRNILNMRKIIREHQIDVVHAHSRAASWIAYFAVKGLGVPLISTVHGRQHVHRSSKGFDIYGSAIIVVNSELKDHLVDELDIKPKKINIIPNGFTFAPEGAARSEYLRSDNKVLIAVAGRASGPKGQRTVEVLENVLAPLMREMLFLHVLIVGGELLHHSPENQVKIKNLQHEFGDRIEISGYQKNLGAALFTADLVFAAGRIAVESLSEQIPVFAMGENAALGIVDDTTIDRAISANFGDSTAHGFEKIDYAEIFQVTRKFAQNTASSKNRVATSPKVVDKIRAYYDLNRVEHEIRLLYESTRAKLLWPRPIPALMFHKIPDAALPSKHRIFVVRDRFEKHLAYLRRRGYQSLTFPDYDAFRTGKRPAQEFPKRPIFLTFDDGYRDNLSNAAPLLKKYGFKGIIFLLADHSIDHNVWDTSEGDHRSEIMSLEEKRLLVELGFEIGAHGMGHRDLTKLSVDEVLVELRECKRKLEHDLGLKESGKEIMVFAYPYGRYNSAVAALTAQAGFKYAMATDNGGIHLEDNPFEIFRVNVFPEDRGFRFAKKASWIYRYHFRWTRGV